MTKATPLFIFLVLFLSCKNNQSVTAKLNPLSLWLVQNEDSMYSYAQQFIKNKNLSNRIIYWEDFIDTLDFKILNRKIAQCDSCISVRITYTPKQRIQFGILLTSDYNKSCVSSIDEIFSDIDSLKHFRLVKFRPAKTFGELINGNDTIKANQLRFTDTPHYDKYNLTIYFPKPVTEDSKDLLIHDIFGEEVLEKKIDSINYKVLKDTVPNSKSVRDIQDFFNVINK